MIGGIGGGEERVGNLRRTVDWANELHTTHRRVIVTTQTDERHG